MGEQMWYYIKESKQEGPILQSKMQEMFDLGILGPETLVWSEKLVEWKPASKVDVFKVEISHSPPPLPKKEPPSMSSFGPVPEIPDEKVSQVRPWVRYWARMIDIYSFSILAFLALGLISPSMLKIVLEMPDIFVNMLWVFLWVFVESSFLSILGNTPGKWLLKISLRNS